jgi:hypothetical protein
LISAEPIKPRDRTQGCARGRALVCDSICASLF